MADQQPDRVSYPTLVMTGGSLDGEAYPLPLTGKPIVLGSSQDADVQILLGNIEAAHAFITFSGGTLVLADAGTETGTFVNGEKVEGDRPIGDGDRICLGPPGSKGSAKLVLRLPTGTHAPQATQPALGPPDQQPALADQEAAPALSADTGPGPDAGPGADTGLELAPEGPDRAGWPQRDARAAPMSAAHPEPTLALDADAVRFDSEPTLSLEPMDVDSEPTLSLEPAIVDPAPGFGLEPAAAQTMPSPAPPAAPPPAPEPAPRTAAPAPPAAPPAPPAAPAPAPRAAMPPPPPAPAPHSTPHAAAAAARPASTPAPAPAPAERPAYHSELPSIPVPASARAEAARDGEGYPALRPFGGSKQKKAAPPAGRASARRGGFSMPSLPLLPILITLAVAGALGAGAWLMLRRTPPELVSVMPLQAEPGQKVKLTGRNFASNPAANTVLFGSLPATVAEASTSELTVLVPEGARLNTPVVVQTRQGRTTPISLTVLAIGVATGIEPDVAMPGQTVLVRGKSLSDKVSVLVAGAPAASLENVPEGVRAVIPDVGLPEGVKTTLTVTSGSTPARTFDLVIGRLPLVSAVAPESGPVGQLVTLKGRGFAEERRGNSVTIGDQPALVVSATRTELQAVVPAPGAGDIQTELAVSVTSGGSTSSARAVFRLVRGTTSGFRPRFFAAPVAEHPGDDLAFVATEIGPVLLLAGRPGGPGAGERAVSAAAGLNALVERSPDRPAAIELRERPEPAVAVAGEARPLLTPTAEDAAAYSRPWETGKGSGRRVSAAGVARHWAALLHDYLGLFLRRERPLQLPALSPRGRVLSDIYAEASRRAPSERTVPTSVVLPTGAAMAAALRQMALVVSSEAPQAAVAVEGRWRGRVDDPEQGAVAFQAQLRRESGRLAGTLATQVGSIEVRTSLRDVSFERGRLRFTADLRGAANVFQGTLAGDNITGTVERSGGGPRPFTMQFVE